MIAIVAPAVSILTARPIVETVGYEPPIDGDVISGQFELPHGVTDRYVEVKDGRFFDVHGDEVTEPLVGWKEIAAWELAEWEQVKREQCAACEGTGFYRAWSDSGMGCVAPCHEDHPGAHECRHDGQLDQWRA